MNPGQIEQVSEELAANLPVCSRCSQAPIILKQLTGVPLRPQIKIICGQCESLRTVTELQWHPSLFEAVNIWSLTAKLLGAETPQGVANMAGDGPPSFEGRKGCAVYTDLKTGVLYHWYDDQWQQVANDVPF